MSARCDCRGEEGRGLRPVNLIIAGVGGQGILLVTKVLAEAAVADGLEVVVSEVHGMAQRGGSVVSTVRFGEAPSPLLGRGEADAILALEPMESLRVLHLASPATVVVSSSTAVPPLDVVLGKGEYPPSEQIFRKLRAATQHVYTVDSRKIATDLGVPAVANVILLGILLETGVLPIRLETVRRVLAAQVPEGTEEINLKALEMGLDLGAEEVVGSS